MSRIKYLQYRVKDAVRNWLDVNSTPTTDVQGNTILASIGIDRISKLPVNFEPPECPICMKADGTQQDDQHCWDCGMKMSDHQDAVFGTGVESVSVTHLHMHTVPTSKGSQVRIQAKRKLCISCFRIDWTKVHPEKPCDL